MGRREPFDELVAEAASDPDDAEAQYLLGDMFLALGRFAEARTAFDRVLDLDEANTTELADDAFLDRSLATYLAGFPAQAAAQLDEFVTRYPASDRADQGLFFHGMFLIEAGEQSRGETKLREAAARTSLDFIKNQAARLTAEE
jgi:TolA-binding protein